MFGRFVAAVRRWAGFKPVGAAKVELALSDVAKNAAVVLADEDAKSLSPLNLRRTRSSLFAARLRCVARLNGRKGR